MTGCLKKIRQPFFLSSVEKFSFLKNFIFLKKNKNEGAFLFEKKLFYLKKI